MSLYLAIFVDDDDDDELAGVEVGSYDDFDQFRSAIADSFEGGSAGSEYPILQMHADSDGVWTVDECRQLLTELRQIATMADANQPLRRARSTDAVRILDSYADVDGVSLVARLIELAECAIASGRPVEFV